MRARTRATKSTSESTTNERGGQKCPLRGERNEPVPMGRTRGLPPAGEQRVVRRADSQQGEGRRLRFPPFFRSLAWRIRSSGGTCGANSAGRNGIGSAGGSEGFNWAGNSDLFAQTNSEFGGSDGANAARMPQIRARTGLERPNARPVRHTPIDAPRTPPRPAKPVIPHSALIPPSIRLCSPHSSLIVPW